MAHSYTHRLMFEHTQHRLNGGVAFGHIVILFVTGDEHPRLILEHDGIRKNDVEKFGNVGDRLARNGGTVNDEDHAQSRRPVLVEILRAKPLVTGDVHHRQDLVFDFRDEMSFIVLYRRASQSQLFVDKSEEHERLAGVAGTHEQHGATSLRASTHEEEDDGEEDDDDADDHAQGQIVSLNHVVDKVLYQSLHGAFLISGNPNESS